MLLCLASGKASRLSFATINLSPLALEPLLPLRRFALASKPPPVGGSTEQAKHGEPMGPGLTADQKHEAV